VISDKPATAKYEEALKLDAAVKERGLAVRPDALDPCHHIEPLLVQIGAALVVDDAGAAPLGERGHGVADELAAQATRFAGRGRNK